MGEVSTDEKVVGETALAELWAVFKEENNKCARIATGTYTGTGEATIDVNVGFYPQFVRIWRANVIMQDETSSKRPTAGIAIRDYPAIIKKSSADYEVLVVTETGFRAFCTHIDSDEDVETNKAGTVFCYLAIG